MVNIRNNWKKLRLVPMTKEKQNAYFEFMQKVRKTRHYQKKIWLSMKNTQK